MDFVIVPLVIVTVMSAVLLREQNPRKLRMPWVTTAIFALTLVVGAIAVFDDAVLDAIRRDGDRLAAGEWWRLITPLVGQDGGLAGLIFNLSVLAVLGAIVENVLGWRLLLITYVAAGLVSEIAAYTVMQGQGFAGNSVAVFGLGGLVCVSAALSSSGARIIGLIGLALGVVLFALWDLHAVGFLVGVLIGLARWLSQRPRTRTRMSASRVAPGSSGESSAGS